MVLHLVEVSPKLREAQRQRLQGTGVPIMWHRTLDDVPAGPIIIVANEFIDALPIHQAVRKADGWHERVVEIAPGGELSFGAARDPLPHFDATLPRALRQSPEGSIYEWRPDTVAIELGRRVRTGGVILLIDYGHAKQGLGETLQAVAGHAFADPLRAPGKPTSPRMSISPLWRRVRKSSARRVHGPVSQRDFLRRLGIDKRAAALKSRVPAEKASEIDSALARLTDTGPKGMGDLFKVLALADPAFGALPGFEK